MSFFDLPPIIERMLLVSDKISDLNFSVGQLPQVEINGKLTPVQPLGMQKLTPYQTEIIAMTLLHGNPDAAERLAQNRDSRPQLFAAFPSTLSRQYLSAARCLLNRDAGYSHRYPDVEVSWSAGSPRGDCRIFRNGLVLVTGPTGSGKSSTQAAIIDMINEKKHYHVVTIEDPIEYLHSHKNSTINQREVGYDTRDFPSALRATLTSGAQSDSDWRNARL